MIVSLTEKLDDDADTVGLVGGKAASLMKLYSIPNLSGHVPSGYALTVDFFAEWVDIVLASSAYGEALAKLSSPDGATNADLTRLCDKVKTFCRSELKLSESQKATIQQISNDMETQWKLPLAAVRSSAPEEDGTGASFAGAFETVLGVPSTSLVDAVKQCFASLFDFRVFSYISKSGGGGKDKHKPAFAAVVMEMVDSQTAGVAFSVNPINSDLDELVVDCSYGLGESVVDGSVVADRYVYNKVDKALVEVTVGSKQQERVLDRTNGGGIVQEVTEERQQKRTLSDEQMAQLAHLVCSIEEAYGMPMDVEFAFSGKDSGDGKELDLRLLQARPITTLYSLDKDMLTAPGEPRKLYYDYNVASEATTTEPFKYLDFELYNLVCSVWLGVGTIDVFPRNPDKVVFSSSTRQYMNLSYLFRWVSPESFASQAELLDPYLARTFRSRDCDQKRYRSKTGAKELSISNAFWLFKQLPLFSYYMNHFKYINNPVESKAEYARIVEECFAKAEEVRIRGIEKDKGLYKHIEDLLSTCIPAMHEELTVMFAILPAFDRLDRGRREGKTKEIRDEYDALCGGYEGDPLMEENIAMYKLARSLPDSIWAEYNHDSFGKLAERIQANLDGKRNDIPVEFLDKWKAFMKAFGYDGTPQLFVSSPRYVENPEMLLAKISHSVGDGIVDPAKSLEARVANRREAMAREEERAKKQWWNPWAVSKVQKRNNTLENLMWIRNSPKIHLAYLVGMLREAVLAVESDLIKKGMLEQPGDAFHLGVDEIDKALLGSDASIDLMELVRPRRARYEQAKRATVCPILIDSRNRILRPDVHHLENKPGVLVGAAISPGVATGRVRIVHDPTEPFETGEVLATVVTDPAWTPLFVGAAAVVFQVGGALQHGALCAREYGKPGVSGIEIHSQLKTGMLVSVDGNTGVVTILEEEGS